MEKISAFISFFCLLAVGVRAWPHGSVATCPDGSEPTCPYVPSGIHDIKLPHPTDCHYFIHCDAGGQPICKECPADLHFNNVSKDCDWPDVAGCQSAPISTAVPPPPPPSPSPPPPPPSTTTSVTTTVSTVPTPAKCSTEEPVCPTCDCDGERESHPDECEWYFECQNGKLHLQKCKNGWHYNPVNKVCDYPCNVGCGNSTGSGGVTPIPPTSTPDSGGSGGGGAGCPSTNGIDIPKCPIPQPAYEVYFPHPANCGWFYHCSNGYAYCKDCPAGLHWNNKDQICDWPYQAGCNI